MPAGIWFNYQGYFHCKTEDREMRKNLKVKFGSTLHYLPFSSIAKNSVSENYLWRLNKNNVNSVARGEEEVTSTRNMK